MRQLLKLFIALFFGISGVYAQCPQNIGFESGTFANWEAYSGSIGLDGVINVQSTIPELDRHTIESGEDVDGYGDFPTVSPNGGKYSVRLGNEGTGREVQRLSYSLTVPSNMQYSLILSYAVVFQNPSHSEFQQPRFTVTVYNETDNQLVECPAFNFIASASLPGFKLSKVRGATEIYYKDWSSTIIELSAYAGKKIRLEFTVNDCTQGGHFGYAYFDINENCQNAITGNVICANQDFATLQGPKGFADYKWYNSADMVNSVWDKQSFPISPAPPVGTKYILKVTAPAGLGCPGEFNTVIERVDKPFIFRVEPTMYFCQGTTFDLTAPTVTAGSSPGLLPFEYYVDDVSQEYLPNPDRVSKPGIYYIRGTNPEGCTNVLRIELKFYDDVSFSATDPAPVEYPNKADLSETHTKVPTYQYFYYSDDKFTKAVTNFRNISASGKYYIKAITEYGCEKTGSVNVIVNPPPPYVITAPTVFTPNDDGINDLFNLTIKGLVDFGTLSIYNRAGQLLFKTNKQATAWNGKFSGRTLNAGAYYWLFEGTDQYYHTKIIKSGNVNIIK